MKTRKKVYAIILIITLSLLCFSSGGGYFSTNSFFKEKKTEFYNARRIENDAYYYVVIKHIKDVYEGEVWKVCQDEIEADYSNVREEIQRISDPDILFILLLCYNGETYPSMTEPDVIFPDIDCDSPDLLLYETKYQYVATLKAHSHTVVFFCVLRLIELEKQGDEKAGEIMQYVRRNIKIPTA